MKTLSQLIDEVIESIKDISFKIVLRKLDLLD